MTPGQKALVPDPTITSLLLAWREGKPAALEELIPLVYAELRRIAKYHMRREKPGQTLQTTALANEAYLRLVETHRIEWRDRTHFFAMASRLMRRILVDAARARHAGKRGGTIQRVRIDEAVDVSAGDGVDLVALDDALKALAASHPRHARVVEMRFFGGLGAVEIASVLGVSPNTVTRDWAFAKLWLQRQLARTAG